MAGLTCKYGEPAEVGVVDFRPTIGETVGTVNRTRFLLSASQPAAQIVIIV
jgi:hypothetical protein